MDEHGRGGWSETRTVKGTESVKVAAGTFRAVRVDVMQITFSDSLWFSTEWYAAGVGLVKEESGGKVVRELKEVRGP